VEARNRDIGAEVKIAVPLSALEIAVAR